LNIIVKKFNGTHAVNARAAMSRPHKSETAAIENAEEHLIKHFQKHDDR
jgi:hypothetical protein